jgi:hypothetical protein
MYHILPHLDKLLIYKNNHGQRSWRENDCYRRLLIVVQVLPTPCLKYLSQDFVVGSSLSSALQSMLFVVSRTAINFLEA